MRRSWAWLWVLLIGWTTLAQQEQKPPTLSRPGDEGSAPSLAGPHSASTHDARQLGRVRTVFIEPIDNGLAEKLAEEIGHKGPFQIVADRRQADAVLSGTCFDSARLKTLHSEVYLTGRDGQSIWQDIIHQRYKPPPLTDAVENTAEVAVADLNASVRETQQK